MLDINRYIENGIVKRERIALDIKKGVLSKNDIQALIDNEKVKKAFIGTDYKNKKPQSEWNRQYLDELSFGAVAEGFNVDYLWHLYDVKCFVNQKQDDISIKATKKIAYVIIGIIAVVILVLLLIQVREKDVEKNNNLVNQAETIVTNTP